MNFKLIFVFALLLNSSFMFSQAGQDKILMTIHDREITIGEFERYYKKNASALGTVQSADEYIEHFINFKLKVIEAEELGYDTTEAFIKEYTGYSEQLAKPYLTKKKDMEDLLREAYERAQTDLHISHIIVPLNQGAPPADTSAAFEMAVNIRQRILNGEEFDSVAKYLTGDTINLASGGELGYITVFGLLYQLETAAYGTETGKISQPVRTEYGYHLIKVNKRRLSPGYIKVAHVMVFAPDTATEKQKGLAEWKIWAVHDSLMAGYPFEELARRNSDDLQSAELGGELPYFKTGQILPDYQETALTLNKPGEFSRPFKTQYGWHLIKLLDKQPIGNYEAMRTEHTNQIKQYNRLRSTRLLTLARMKKKYDYREISSDISDFLEIIDERIFDGIWTIPDKAVLNEVLFTIGGKEYTQMDFALYLQEIQSEITMTERTLITRKFTDFTEASLFAYEKEQLPVNYPEFKFMLQEYHDGILNFNLTDNLIISRSVQDKTGLKAFYSDNKKDYLWNDRLECILISCEQEEIAEKAVKIILDQENEQVSRASLIASLCAPHYRSECILFTVSTFEAGDHELADKMNWDNRLSEIFEHDGRFVFIVRMNIIPAGQKSLNEARGQVISDYQEHLEQLLISKLRQKYRFKVNRRQLSKID